MCKSCVAKLKEKVRLQGQMQNICLKALSDSNLVFPLTDFNSAYLRTIIYQNITFKTLQLSGQVFIFLFLFCA